MIISRIFEQVFKDMTLTYNEYSSTLKSYKEVTKSVQYHFGDNKELAKWIRGRGAKQKYPLIWYVIEPLDNSNINTLNHRCCLYLFTSTKTEYYNNTRALINYSNILEPLTQKIMGLMDSTNGISLIFKDYESFFKTFDIPNFGVDDDERDWIRKELKSTKSITIDIVDARKVDFQVRFDKTSIQNCLI